jgi:hypothetical protein
MKAIAIEANGDVKRVDLPDYDALNKAVGGYIEAINFGDTGHNCYVNENGIALGLPYNPLATALCFKHNVGLMPGDYIKGTMVVVGPVDDDGNDTDVQDELAEQLLSPM